MPAASRVGGTPHFVAITAGVTATALNGASGKASAPVGSFAYGPAPSWTASPVIDWVRNVYGSAMSVTSTAWSVFTWATAGLSRSRMPSRSAACGPGTPAISETAAVGLVTQAGEGVQMGWVKRRI